MNKLTYKIISYSQIKNKTSLSSADYTGFIIINKNSKELRSLIKKKFVKGKEVGSNSYVTKSSKFFLRTKSLQEETFLLDTGVEAAIPIVPTVFVNNHLKTGLVIISKDSNIGEVAFLEKDYLNHMLCAGLIGIKIKKNPFYVLAFLKNKFFKNQLNSTTWQ